MNKIHNSLALAKASWGVLRADKELIAIPIMEVIVSVVVAGVFGGLGFALGIFKHSNSSNGNNSLSPAAWVLFAVTIFALSLVQTYFLGALVGGALQRLKGENPSLSTAFAAASLRIVRLMEWAVVLTALQLVVRLIEQRFRFIGRLLGGIFEGAWNVLTFIAIPIILEENLNPVDTLKESGRLFKKTWGENLVAQLGFGIIGLFVVLPCLALVGLGVLAMSAQLYPIGILLFAAAFITFVGGMAVLSALMGIYRAALYRFATTGETPAAFGAFDFATAFKRKIPKGRAENGFN